MGSGKAHEMTTLGGTLIAHNCLSFDYCIKEAIESLLPVCDQVVLLDAESTDGTLGLLKSYKSEKVSVIQSDWIPQHAGAHLALLTNKALASLRADMHINLQADEVLHEYDYAMIRESAQSHHRIAVTRHNFWLDHRHVVPHGRTCSSTIIRIAPCYVPSTNDAESLGHTADRHIPAIRIFHYGLIRKPNCLVNKSRQMQADFWGHYDPIFDDVEQRGRAAMIDPKWSTAVKMEELIPYHGSHPKVAHGWLKERGFEP